VNRDRGWDAQLSDPETEARVVNGLVIEAIVQATKAGTSPATTEVQAVLAARQKNGFRGERALLRRNRMNHDDDEECRYTG
jgi:hypothetical protein